VALGEPRGELPHGAMSHHGATRRASGYSLQPPRASGVLAPARLRLAGAHLRAGASAAIPLAHLRLPNNSKKNILQKSKKK
jgi:hypothetical protein